MKKKNLPQLAIAITFVMVGIRVFNHIHAWLGIIICLCAIYPIYKLFKSLLKDETED